MKILLIFRFFHYTWFIDSKKLCFILISKEKMTRFLHLISGTLIRGNTLKDFLTIIEELIMILRDVNIYLLPKSKQR